MRKSGYILTVFSVLAMVLTACGRRSGIEESVVTRRTARGASALLQGNVSTSSIPLAPPGTKSWGELVLEPPDLFQLAIQGLMQATVSPQEIGVISGRTGNITGVRFWGSVDLQSGALNSATLPATGINLNTAQLRIVIWDSFAGTEDSNGNTIPEYAISFDRAVSGTVSGSTANIVFEDTYGRVTVSGNFDQNQFQGQMSYENFTSFNSSVIPAAGILGNFVVRTCGFFDCQ